jgi:hypothetical protein
VKKYKISQTGLPAPLVPEKSAEKESQEKIV